jgi:hypothetical protein
VLDAQRAVLAPVDETPAGNTVPSRLKIYTPAPVTVAGVKNPVASNIGRQVKLLGLNSLASVMVAAKTFASVTALLASLFVSTAKLTMPAVGIWTPLPGE